MIYLIGSLKDARVREVADALRDAGEEVFDDWHAAGPEADMHWRVYEQERGRRYVEALYAPFAQNGFRFDRDHLDRSRAAIAVAKPNKMPGRSSIAELSYMRWARAQPTYLLLDGEPEEWDLMLPLAVPIHSIFYDIGKLVEAVKR